jgi:hypothetical protein
MGSHKFPIHSYDSSTLDKLNQAFETAWAAFNANRSPQDPKPDDELRTVLAKSIMALAASGETDPKKLWVQALENLLRSQEMPEGDPDARVSASEPMRLKALS